MATENEQVKAAEQEAQAQAAAAQKQAAEQQEAAKKQIEEQQKEMKKNMVKGMIFGALTTVGAKLLNKLVNKIG